MSGVILSLETSCDETAVALVDGQGEVLVSRVASQIALHAPYGGVVPELACRNHSSDLRPLIEGTLREAGLGWGEVSAVAATSGPGLSSSLLIGDTTAKAMALALDVPFYSINHMEGHLLSPFIGRGVVIPRHMALIVSGGHTLLVKVNGVADYEVIGSTLDDAAGEAFDKVGKLLGLGYPGGPEVSGRAESGRRDAYAFPRSMIDSGDFDFSFSGLKTAVRYTLDKLGQPLSDTVCADVCASFEEAVVDVLLTKLYRASREHDLPVVAISGGVSCNKRLRELAASNAEKENITLFLADGVYSTDNAAMIGFVCALHRHAGLAASPLDTDIDPNRTLACVNSRNHTVG